MVGINSFGKDKVVDIKVLENNTCAKNLRWVGIEGNICIYKGGQIGQEANC